MRAILIAMLCLMILLLPGCTSARGKAFTLAQRSPDEALVYVYRPVDEGYDKFRIAVDGEPVAQLLKGGYFPIASHPGEITISSELILRPNLPALMVTQLAQPGSMLVLDLGAGQTAYVRLERVLGPRLVRVDEAEAIEQLARCRLVPALPAE